MTPAPGAPLPCGIGVIRRGEHVLIRRRPPLPGSPMPGYWEFPGGKCEPGETPEQAALRECREEVGLPIVARRLRRVVRHTYPHGFVELHYFDCHLADDRAEPDPATGFRWAHISELPGLTFPAANDVIVAELVAEYRGA